MFYLMLKTHLETGLHYLCYTSKKDPYKYRGSGKRWKNHIKTHGSSIGTHIIIASDNLKTIKLAGEKFSAFWNVVENPNFANLRIEEGDGGDTSSFIDYKSMKPMPTGQWKRPDLSSYNSTRVNPNIKVLTCHWCSAEGYGYEFRKKHLSLTANRDVNQHNCAQNPNPKMKKNTRLFNIGTEQLTVEMISKKYGLPITTINNRLFQGMDIQSIVNQPLLMPLLLNIEDWEGTINQTAKQFSISAKSIRSLLSKGYSSDFIIYSLIEIRDGNLLYCPHCQQFGKTTRFIHQHFETCRVKTGKYHTNEKTYQFDSQTLTVKQISTKYNIPIKTIYSRLSHGKTMEQIIGMGSSQKKKIINLDDQTFGVDEFIKRYGISRTTFYRYRDKMEPSDIIKQFGNVS